MESAYVLSEYVVHHHYMIRKSRCPKNIRQLPIGLYQNGLSKPKTKDISPSEEYVILHNLILTQLAATSQILLKSETNTGKPSFKKPHTVIQFTTDSGFNVGVHSGYKKFLSLGTPMVAHKDAYIYVMKGDEIQALICPCRLP